MFEDSNIWVAMGVIVSPLVLTLWFVILLLVWALKKWTRYLETQTENALVERIAYKFNTVLMGFVHEQNQTIVEPKKKARAANNNGGPLLTDIERKRYARMVVDKIKAHLQPERLNEIVETFGFDPTDEAKINGFLHAQVELAVSSIKLERITSDGWSCWNREGEAEGPFEGKFAPR